MASVFEKQRLSAVQARTVSDRRLADAIALRDTRRNAHANGAMYLGGIALELLLKALLLEEHPWLVKPFGDSAKRSPRERELFELCHLRHDLRGLLERLPTLHRRLAGVHSMCRRTTPLLQTISKLCSEWSIHVRYSTRQANVEEARLFLEGVKELRPWLK